MDGRLALLFFVTVLLSPVSVSGLTISVPSTSLNEGETLSITCQQPESGKSLYSIRLDRANAAQPSGYETIVQYELQSRAYQQTWGDGLGDFRQRANVTESFNGETSGSFVVTLGPVRCSDAAAFRCQVSQSGIPSTDTTDIRNVTIHGVTQSVQITGADECNMVEIPECSGCVNFGPSPPAVPTPKYAKMGQPLVLTCQGMLATPSSRNMFIWYKQTANDFDKLTITENKTTDYDPPAENACTVIGRSTLTYYPQPTDRELRISCEVTYTGSNNVVDYEISVCIEGLIASTTSSPASGSNPGANTAGLGAGPIAGIIIGVIAVIVLVVVLVYFLWYRRRDGGESYNTREADGRSAPPPVSKKPEMHENSMYDASGDTQQNNYYNNRSNKYNTGGGKTNQAMEDDYYHHDNDTAPRIRDPIGSSV